jgi:hypothetical protein
VADGSTDEKLDRIIELLGEIVEAVKQTADSTIVVSSEVGSAASELSSILFAVQNIEENASRVGRARRRARRLGRIAGVRPAAYGCPASS